MDANEWLRLEAIKQTRAEAQKVEDLIVGHFGSAEKALRMVTLFPGRFVVEGSETSIFNLFGAPSARVYKLRDKLRPEL